VSPTENSYSRPVPATFLVFLTCQLRDEAGTILSRRSPRRKPRGFAAHILIILQGDGSRHEINVADPTSEYSRGTEYARRNRLPEITNVIDCSTHTHTRARTYMPRACKGASEVRLHRVHFCNAATIETPIAERRHLMPAKKDAGCISFFLFFFLLSFARDARMYISWRRSCLNIGGTGGTIVSRRASRAAECVS